MKSVTIYKLQDDGNQVVLAKCSLATTDMVVCEGDPIFIENLEKDGIKDYSNLRNGAILFPRDGLKFLENLRYAFRSGYLSSSEIIDDETDRQDFK